MRSSAAATVCAGPTISHRSCSRISSSNMAIRGSSSSKRTRGIRLLPCQQSVVIPHRGYPRTQSEEGSPDHRAVWLAITNATGSPVLHCCSMASFSLARELTARLHALRRPEATSTGAKGSMQRPSNGEQLAMYLVGQSCGWATSAPRPVFVRSPQIFACRNNGRRHGPGRWRDHPGRGCLLRGVRYLRRRRSRLWMIVESFGEIRTHPVPSEVLR
jgi:hypothetical protein